MWYKWERFLETRDAFFDGKWSASISTEEASQADAEKYNNGKPAVIKTLRMIPFLNKVANYYYGLDINEQDPDSVKQLKDRLAGDFGEGFADKVMEINEMLNKTAKKCSGKSSRNRQKRLAINFVSLFVDEKGIILLRLKEIVLR